MISGLLEILIVVAASIVYFIPYFIASIRNHNNHAHILVVNLTLGWTILGWFAALIWSLTGNVGDKGTAMPVLTKDYFLLMGFCVIFIVGVLIAAL